MGITIVQKPKNSGNLYLQINHNGFRKYRKCGNMRTCKEAKRIMEAELYLDDFSLETKSKKKNAPTFKQYSEQFLQGYSKMKHEPSTRADYKSKLKNHILPSLGKKPIDEITKQDIKNFLIQKQNEGYATNSVQLFRKYTSAILEQAVDDEIISFNPAYKASKYIKKNPTKKVEVFSPEEFERFLQAVKEYEPKHYPMLSCAILTGLRQSELIVLKPEDIDFDRQTIDVVRKIDRQKNISLPKHNKTRPVEMTSGLADILKEYLTERKKEALKKGWGKPPEWLFYNKNGDIININNFIKRKFYKILEKAGLKKITFHGLRHTFATIRLQSGYSMDDVSIILGHADTKTTRKFYYHWEPNQNPRRDEIDRLGKEKIRGK